MFQESKPSGQHLPPGDIVAGIVSVPHGWRWLHSQLGVIQQTVFEIIDRFPFSFAPTAPNSMDQQSQHSEGNDNEAASSSVDVTAKRPRRAAPARAAAAASSSSKPKKSRPVQKDSNGSEQAGTSNADMNGDNDDDDEDEDVCPACVNIPYEQRKNKAKHVPWIACDELSYSHAYIGYRSVG